MSTPKVTVEITAAHFLITANVCGVSLTRKWDRIPSGCRAVEPGNVFEDADEDIIDTELCDALDGLSSGCMDVMLELPV